MFAKFRIRKKNPDQPASETNMSISGISSALNIASLVGGALRSATGSQQESASPNAQDPAQSALAEIAKLLPPGGLNEIKPEQFAAFARELHDRGVISDAEFNDLAAIRLELELSGSAADETVDVIGFLKDRIARLESQYDAPEGNTEFSLGQALDVARRRLDFVQQLDTTLRQGVNAVA